MISRMYDFKNVIITSRQLEGFTQSQTTIKTEKEQKQGPTSYLQSFYKV